MKKNVVFRTEIMHFKKWTRQSFASFASMKKQVRIGVLASVYCIASVPMDAQEKQASDRISVTSEYDLEEVEVLAGRSTQVYSQLNRVVTVISKDEIQQSGAVSLNDVLKSNLGVDVRQRGPLGVQADISIRGGSFDQALILLNGIKFNDPQTGHHNLNLPVDLDQVERIEIIEGSTARMYGPNAFSGAINIVTKSGKVNELDVLVQGGEYGLFKLAPGIQFKKGKLQSYLAFNHSRSDGYIENTDFKNQSAYLQSNLNQKYISLQGQVGYQQKEFGANSFYTNKYPDQFEEVSSHFASLKLETKTALKLSAAGYYKLHNDRFELFREDKYKYAKDGVFVHEKDTAGFGGGYYYKGHNYHQTFVYGLDANLSYQSEFGKTLLGFDYRKEHIYSNVLGELMDSPKDVRGERGQFTKEKERESISVYLEHGIQYGDFGFSGGFIYYRSSISNHFSAGFEASYRLSTYSKLYAGVNQSFRLPTFTDLYYSGPSNIGNPDLKPEEAISYELGYKLGKPALRSHVSIYYRLGTNAIDWVRLADEAKYTTMNHTELNTFGVEFNNKIQFAALGWNQKWLQSMELGYAFINVEKDAGKLISAYALDYLKHKLKLGFNFRIAERWGINWFSEYYDRVGSYTFNGAEKDYESFFLSNLKLSYSLKQVNIFASVNNVFDKEYRDLGTTQMPGRWISGGVKWRFRY